MKKLAGLVLLGLLAGSSGGCDRQQDPTTHQPAPGEISVPPKPLPPGEGPPRPEAVLKPPPGYRAPKSP